MHISNKMKDIFQNTDYFDYIRESDEIKSMIEEPIPGIIQLCTQLIKMPGYEYISHIRNKSSTRFISEINPIMVRLILDVLKKLKK